MLKYTDAKVVFREIPDEVTLAINISNCPVKCQNCHSAYLAEDIGTELTFNELLKLCCKNAGITCVAFMGGDADPAYINQLANVIKEGELNLKVAWYSGRQGLSECIEIENFDFIKLGPYIEELGPLTSKTTNQVMLHIDNSCGKPIVKDITSRFWK